MASINDLAAAAIATSSTQGEHGRGALVVLEGLDRSGKTTQVKLLEQRFVEAGRKVKVMRFPGGSLFLARFLCVCVRRWLGQLFKWHGEDHGVGWEIGLKGLGY